MALELCGGLLHYYIQKKMSSQEAATASLIL